MMHNTTLFLGLALIIFLNSGYAIISQLAVPQSEFLKLKLPGSKMAAFSQPDTNLRPQITVVKNTTIIKLRETINDWETFTIQPSEQIIKIKNINVYVFVDLIHNVTSLKSYKGEKIIVKDSKNDYSAMLTNKRGMLQATYDRHFAFMRCNQKQSDVSFDRKELTLITKTFRIDYNRRLEIVKISNEKESIKIDLMYRYIENTGGKKLSGDKLAWQSAYGSVVFNDNSLIIVYDSVNLTINLLTKPYTLAISSLRANLIETPTNVTLECDVGKITMNNHYKTIELTSINRGQVGIKSQIFFNDYYAIITNAEQSALIVKSQKDVIPLSMLGMYGSMKVYSTAPQPPY